jgi:hypothetical protein
MDEWECFNFELVYFFPFGWLGLGYGCNGKSPAMAGLL